MLLADVVLPVERADDLSLVAEWVTFWKNEVHPRFSEELLGGVLVGMDLSRLAPGTRIAASNVEKIIPQTKGGRALIELTEVTVPHIERALVDLRVEVRGVDDHELATYLFIQGQRRAG